MQFYLEFPSVSALREELETNLSKSRAFVPGACEAEEGDLAELVLIHPTSGEWMPLAATVVLVTEGDQPGVGLQLAALDVEGTSALRDYVDSSPRSVPPSAVPSSKGYSDRAPHPANVQERVRGLSARERENMARTGSLTERTALERAYGSLVWDTLLANLQLTGPEVARIAKNGFVTIPHLNLITSNAGWLSKPEVRRALLTNPRLSAVHIDRILRCVPSPELKLMPKQTAYPAPVRAAAEKKLKK